MPIETSKTARWGKRRPGTRDGPNARFSFSPETGRQEYAFCYEIRTNDSRVIKVTASLSS